MMKEIVPKLSRVGVLGQTRARVEFSELDAASRKVDIVLDVVDMQTPGDLEGALSTMVTKRVGTLLVVVSPLTYLLKESIGIGDQISAADDLQREPVCRGRAPDELRAEAGGSLSASRDLCRQDP